MDIYACRESSALSCFHLWVPSMMPTLHVVERMLRTRQTFTDVSRSIDGVAGIVGLVFTGVWAQKDIAATDGYSVIDGGWLDGNYIQVGKQLAYICAVWGWCVVP